MFFLYLPGGGNICFSNAASSLSSPPADCEQTNAHLQCLFENEAAVAKSRWASEMTLTFAGTLTVLHYFRYVSCSFKRVGRLHCSTHKTFACFLSVKTSLCVLTHLAVWALTMLTGQNGQNLASKTINLPSIAPLLLHIRSSNPWVCPSFTLQFWVCKPDYVFAHTHTLFTTELCDSGHGFSPHPLMLDHKGQIKKKWATQLP